MIDILRFSALIVDNLEHKEWSMFTSSFMNLRDEFDFSKIDTNKLWSKFAVWMLIDEKYGILKLAEPQMQLVIEKLANRYERQSEGEHIELKDWLAIKESIKYYKYSKKQVCDNAIHDAVRYMILVTVKCLSQPKTTCDVYAGLATEYVLKALPVDSEMENTNAYVQAQKFISLIKKCCPVKARNLEKLSQNKAVNGKL